MTIKRKAGRRATSKTSRSETFMSTRWQDRSRRPHTSWFTLLTQNTARLISITTTASQKPSSGKRPLFVKAAASTLALVARPERD